MTSKESEGKRLEPISGELMPSHQDRYLEDQSEGWLVRSDLCPGKQPHMLVLVFLSYWVCSVSDFPRVCAYKLVLKFNINDHGKNLT